MLDEQNKPKAKKRRNSTFRAKSKVEEVVRLPLDLEADSPKIRALKHAERRRKGFKVAAMCLLVISVLALGRAAFNETLLRNPRFTLQEIKVDGTGMLSKQQIQTACGVPKGASLLTLDLSEVRDRLLTQPAIRSASVQRDFNGQLTVTVLQRKPIAWIKCEPQQKLPKDPIHSLVVDEEGVAIPVLVVLPEFNDLPVIHDKNLDPIADGRPVTSPRFAAAMTLLKALKSRESRDGIKLASIAAPGRFALDATFDNGTTVTFAYDDLEPQLLRYDHFVTEMREKKWNVASVNLVAMHNVPVNFRTTKSASLLPSAIPVTVQNSKASLAPTPASQTRTARTTTAGKSSKSKSSAH